MNSLNFMLKKIPVGDRGRLYCCRIIFPHGFLNVCSILRVVAPTLVASYWDQALIELFNAYPTIFHLFWRVTNFSRINRYSASHSLAESVCGTEKDQHKSTSFEGLIELLARLLVGLMAEIRPKCLTRCRWLKPPKLMVGVE